MRFIPAVIAIFGLASASGVLAQGCCAPKETAHAGCSMSGQTASGGHEGHGGAAPAAALNKSPNAGNVFMEPVQSVYSNYLKVQGTLAQDSMEGVAASAAYMAKAIRADSMKMLSPKVAQQAEALAKAQNLEAAREAFKPLSESLIQFVKDRKAAAGTYHIAYCPMAKASWLQTGTTIMNPYMGKSMPHCGQLKT